MDKESPREIQWNELGVVYDDETGLAARVYIGVGGRVPIPNIQIGRLSGAERSFHPSLVPQVHWEDGRGEVTDLSSLGVVPVELQGKIDELIKPHLVLEPNVEIEPGDFDLVDTLLPGDKGHAMGCLSCS